MAACHRYGVCTVGCVECMGWQRVIGMVCELLAVLDARGTAVAQWLRRLLQIGRSLVRFQIVSLEFFIDISPRSHYDPGVDSASNRNEYQEHFLEVKAAGA